MVLRLNARTESPELRFTDMLRIGLCIIAVGLGAMLFIVQARASRPPRSSCSRSPRSTRRRPTWTRSSRSRGGRCCRGSTDTIRGAVRPALLLFGLCLIDGDADAPRERVFAWIAGGLALVLGTLNAYCPVGAELRRASGPEHRAWRTSDASYAVSFLCVDRVHDRVRARAAERPSPHRLDRRRVPVRRPRAPPLRRPVSGAHPAVGRTACWYRAGSSRSSRSGSPSLRHHFFNVDFVVSRAVVYVALSAAFFTAFGLIEEVGTYVFYNNTNLAYIVLIRPLLMGVGDGDRQDPRHPRPRRSTASSSATGCSSARRSSSSPATSSTPRPSRTSTVRCCRTRRTRSSSRSAESSRASATAATSSRAATTGRKTSRSVSARATSSRARSGARAAR